MPVTHVEVNTLLNTDGLESLSLGIYVRVVTAESKSYIISTESYCSSVSN